jgi:hypothetical protein
MTTTLQRPRQAAPTDGLHGVNFLERPILNRSTAFSQEERAGVAPKTIPEELRDRVAAVQWTPEYAR